MAETEDNTRERLLDHAERLFAEKGFAAVSVREITGEAGCNLAAVNYHFGGKQNLYLAVFRERWAERARRVRCDFTRALAGSRQPGIEELVSAMARAFLEGPLTDNERRIHILLMQRELVDPGEALDMIVEEIMRPFIRNLSELIRPRLPGPYDENRLRLYVLSILGITLYFFLARPAVTRLLQQAYDDRFKSELVSHITAFAVGGIQALDRES